MTAASAMPGLQRSDMIYGYRRRLRKRENRARTEEQSRNLKVDLSLVPKWERERKEIEDRFRNFDLPKVRAAVSLVEEVRASIWFGQHISTWASEQKRSRMQAWIRQIGWRSLLMMALEPWAPVNVWDELSVLEIGYENGKPSVQRLTLVERMRTAIMAKLSEASEVFSQCRTKGTTDSHWISLFTSKVHVGVLRSWEDVRDKYSALLEKVPECELAVEYLHEIRQESRKYAGRYVEIGRMLELAEEKRMAVDLHEAKYGRDLAKAASLDRKTRDRADSLKHLVQRTEVCPYCGRQMGNEPHLDHIYPVALGGLSVVENLVWCCADCNTLKRDRGLFPFLRKRGVPIEEVLSRLHALGKHV